MTDISIVIPFISGKADSVELRFALRSIEKYLSGVRDIWIIGEPPVWIRDVKVIPCSDSQRVQDHEKNIFNKMLLACNTPEISENFCMWHDDHVIMKDFTASDFPYYMHRSLMQGAQANTGSYRVTLIRTEKLLRSMLLPTLDFDCHCPIVFNKKRFVEVFNGVQWRDYGYGVKSVYGNYWGVEPVECVDLKLNGRKVREMQQAITGREWFSTGSSNEAVQVLLAGLFNKKSKYES